MMAAVEITEWTASARRGEVPVKGVQRVERPAADGGPAKVKFRPPGTWWQHTLRERNHVCKKTYLDGQRDAELEILGAKHGVSVKQEEAALKGMSSNTLDPRALKAYLDAKAAVTDRVRPVYEDPTFRRLRWQGLRHRHRSDAAIVEGFKAKFGGPDTTAICWGDWSETNSAGKAHMSGFQSTRGIGLRRLFAQHGYTVLMTDESYTSKRCHACEMGECKPFRWVRVLSVTVWV